MKPVKLTAKDFLHTASAWPLLDIRSPAEYRKGHIPSAVSFPLFSDEERAIIGTLYKGRGKQAAVKKGLEIVAPKMVGFVERAELMEATTLALYCWRGGMRSASMSWLMNQYGLETVILEGGYKAFRQEIRRFFEQDLPLKVVSGYTGSRKTDFLYMLKDHGAQIIDIEALAQHQGSSFGNEKSEEQPSTEHFQNLVFEAFTKLDLNRTIWVEDECLRIGQVTLIESLFDQKNRSPHIFIEVDKPQRVDFLVRDYGVLSKAQLINATQGIRKKLGNEKADRAIECIENGALKEAAEITLSYYDKQYDKSITRKSELIKEHFKIDMSDLSDLAKKLANES